MNQYVLMVRDVFVNIKDMCLWCGGICALLAVVMTGITNWSTANDLTVGQAAKKFGILYFFAGGLLFAVPATIWGVNKAEEHSRID